MFHQILVLARLFGWRRLAQMKRRHEEALPFLRGYVTTHCWWLILRLELDKEMAGQGLDLEKFCRERGLAYEVLRSICSYLDILRFISFKERKWFLEEKGKRFLAEPRGMFDLAYGYEPIFSSLYELAAIQKKYGENIFRRGEYVAKGSGELGRQLPFPVLAALIRKYNFKSVLDLGCGDAEFLAFLYNASKIKGYGLDNSIEAIDYARKFLIREGLSREIKVEVGDIFETKAISALFPEAEALIAIDVFHEYLSEGEEKIVALLKNILRDFPGIYLVVGEFCLQPEERLKKHPTAFLEHHLFHDLTKQVILSAEDWRRLFDEAGFHIVEEQIFDLVGHGYFVLKERK